MGPSGIGKTTLLMSILGYSDATLSISGRRIYCGDSINANEIPSSALYIPQHSPFNPNWEIMGYLSRLPWRDPALGWGIGKKRARREKVRSVLSELGLAHRSHATVSELSGGESQRAALAQMLLLRPRLLVADEFVSALDPGMSVEILDRLRALVKEERVTCIFATHDIEAAMRTSDEIVVMTPSILGTVPWSIPRGSQAWSSSVMHTIMCLARWAYEMTAGRQVAVVFKFLREILDRDCGVESLLRRYSGIKSGIWDISGEVWIGVSSREDDSNSNLHNYQTSGEMAPFRRAIGPGQVEVGISISRGPSIPSLCVQSSCPDETVETI